MQERVKATNRKDQKWIKQAIIQALEVEKRPKVFIHISVFQKETVERIVRWGKKKGYDISTHASLNCVVFEKSKNCETE